MHGYGANEFDLLGIADFFTEPLTLISLRAPMTLDWGGYAWYELKQGPSGIISDIQTRIQSEETIVNEIKIILEDAKADLGNVYLMGFSQGAAMAYSLLGRHDLGKLGIRVKGLIAMSGYIPEDVNESLGAKDWTGFPVIITHGEFDDLVTPKALTVAEGILSKAGAEVNAKFYPVRHALSDEAISDINNWLTAKVGQPVTH